MGNYGWREGLKQKRAPTQDKLMQAIASGLEGIGVFAAPCGDCAKLATVLHATRALDQIAIQLLCTEHSISRHGQYLEFLQLVNDIEEGR